MRVVHLSEIRDELQGHLRRQELFPIIGSGFTRGCPTTYGEDARVPSGEDMKLYMEQYLLDHGHAAISNSSFSKVARYYEKFVDPKDFCQYIKKHFRGVIISGGRRAFLDIDWKFIYTLNLDDAIEKNSRYQFKVLPNHNLRLYTLNGEKCIFKLHGDAEELIKYRDEKKPILSFTDYLTSLETNKSLLDKLQTDLSYSNTLFVGCSLSDELDLLSVAQQMKEKSSAHKNRYFLTGNTPNEYQLVDLEDHGIDTVILTDDFEAFYYEFSSFAKECNYVLENELKAFCNLPCGTVHPKESIDYLLCGKYLLNKSKGVVLFPNFFIERDITTKILEDMDTAQLQVIHGARVSGKSYLLAGILQQIRNRDTYYFDSRSLVSKQLLSQLLEKKHSVLLFDTNVLSTDAIKLLLQADFVHLQENKTNIIFCANNSDRETLALIGYEKKRLRHGPRIRAYELKHRFSAGTYASPREIDTINKKLKIANLLPFSSSHTILDNLLYMQKKLRIEKPTKFDPPLRVDVGDSAKICLLVLLVQNEKISAKELVQCGLITKNAELLQELKITVEEDHCNLLVQDTIDNVSYQIVCNAKVWLINQLREIGKNSSMSTTIVTAFQRMTSAFLGGTQNFKRVESLVKFDKLNEIFPDGKRLIIDIYEGLKPILDESYQYYHQYSKCHLWGMSKRRYSRNDLNNARIAALTAFSIVEQLDVSTLPHSIAYAHILNTLTIIHTKQCFMEKFKKRDTLEEAIEYFHKAISCKENFDAMRSAKNTRSGSKDEDGGVIQRWITYIMAKEIYIPTASRGKVSEILAYWKTL